jgi:hypothetical protein
MTLEFALKARWCWIIETISSPMSTFEVSMLPAVTWPRPPAPGGATAAGPLSLVSTQRLLPARPSESVARNLATMICPTGTERPLV